MSEKKKKDNAIDIKAAQDILLQAEKVRQERRSITGEKTLTELRNSSHSQIPILFISIVLSAVLPILLWSFVFNQKYTETLLSFSLIATPLVTFFGLKG